MESGAYVEFGTLEREIFVEAAPEVVFEVVSSPGHLRQWWPDDARYDPAPGAPGHLVFDKCAAEPTVVGFTVIEARPPRLFRFRWTHPAGTPAGTGNSLLVTFELTPAPGGTRLRMTETGFREQGWSVAVLEEQYRDHGNGWDFFLPRLVAYAARADVPA